jgi:hypothetical protein
MRIALIGCGDKKLDHAAPARDLYVGNVFAARRDYVEHGDFDAWWIISAKHYLVHPSRVLEPYDESLTKRSVAHRRAWASVVAHQLENNAQLVGTDVEVHAGKAYYDHGLVAALRAIGAHVTVPTEACGGVGYVVQWYARARAARSSG